ncbi:hypothetical protein PHYBLDRAFT_175587 [Phycomyces blakesleeanus NRRL 1555(-)]|uniref:Uncharacterized protein n=1 Tax=Phycomyces blakesleeanus (strain ATCC 8743b / DSM 1359 / FGSC 10004 / NBRC 33097 / NRRL 1555) TaxID=763407 RepID=A0A162T3U9_PHYB8|nr:hypothetical protein PHYBLDRAFT_175587 [Phycomyces blakesleeanus NRRL 1555(-)]OAD66062.1 hypothetical protein PHYBLDRAFT_175587 [Phycomyces blakesleeanus NRRL 1555(-)]|eukprot:XP_018284102.1 hypothetical protein PHYBLDRAFT_175587 [Phycomyces blakesleeanus NRRL 1555(-)]
MGGFLQCGTFPPISLNTFCLPRLQGGLGVIDPKTQQSALQLRWLQLIVCSLRLPPGLVPRWMFGLLQASLPSLSPLFPLLFPSIHPSGWQDLTSPLHLVFTATDRLPHNFDNVVLSPLSLPPKHASLYPVPWSSSTQLNTLTFRLIIVRACCSLRELAEEYPSLSIQDGTSIGLYLLRLGLVFPPALSTGCVPTISFVPAIPITLLTLAIGANFGLSLFLLWLANFGFVASMTRLPAEPIFTFCFLLLFLLLPALFAPYPPTPKTTSSSLGLSKTRRGSACDWNSLWSLDNFKVLSSRLGLEIIEGPLYMASSLDFHL